MKLVAEVIRQSRRQVVLTSLVAASVDVGAAGVAVSLIQRTCWPYFITTRANLIAIGACAAASYAVAAIFEYARRARSSEYLAKQIDRDNGLDDLFVTVAALPPNAKDPFERVCVRQLDARVQAQALQLTRPRVARTGAALFALVFATTLAGIEWGRRAEPTLDAMHSAKAEQNPTATNADTPRVATSFGETSAQRQDRASARAVPPQLAPAPRSTENPGDSDPFGTWRTTAKPRDEEPIIDARHRRADPTQPAEPSESPTGRVSAKVPTGGKDPQPGNGTTDTWDGGDPAGRQATVDAQLLGKWLYTSPSTLLKAAGSDDQEAQQTLRAVLAGQTAQLEKQLAAEQVPARHSLAIERYFLALAHPSSN